MTKSIHSTPASKATGHSQPGGLASGLHPALMGVLDWYFHSPFGFIQNIGALPFYCDPARVGGLAVHPAELAIGGEAALFRLFIQLSMFQALRDVVIMRQQRDFSVRSLKVIADAGFVGDAIANHPCAALGSGVAFEEICDVSKAGKVVDCGRCPGLPCHVKEASTAFNRMGDMGKLPTSAWLRLWQVRGLGAVVAEVRAQESSPSKRAHLLVERLHQVHRVGRKLATMIVSALSTPALAPGLTPWFPEVDGNDLVVVDTNVAQAVDALRGPNGAKTYNARAQWVREQAAQIDLRSFRADLPPYSPRIVQQALYAFCSKSNRTAQGDSCSSSTGPCPGCIPILCPFQVTKEVSPVTSSLSDRAGLRRCP